METKTGFSLISFAKEIKKYIVNPNEKFIKYGVNNDIPNQLLEYYYTIPEHTSCIDFVEQCINKDGITSEKLSFWLVKKVVSDYILFGGYSIQVLKLRNGEFSYGYVDFSKCRYNLDKTMIGYSDEWTAYKPTIKWYPISNGTKEGIYIFNTVKTRETYPMPYYTSSVMSLDTMKSIMEYHNNNANNGFAPNVVININDADNYSEEMKSNLEEGLNAKFTGSKGSKFIVMYNSSADNKTTVEKLDNDNLDQKFETLQKFIQNQIIVSHKLPSGSLIGIKPENTGFSKQEYAESLEIFEEVVINNFKNELEYSFEQLTGEDIKFKSSTNTIQ